MNKIMASLALLVSCTVVLASPIDKCERTVAQVQVAEGRGTLSDRAWTNAVLTIMMKTCDPVALARMTAAARGEGPLDMQPYMTATTNLNWALSHKGKS